MRCSECKRRHHIDCDGGDCTCSICGPISRPIAPQRIVEPISQLVLIAPVREPSPAIRRGRPPTRAVPSAERNLGDCPRYDCTGTFTISWDGTYGMVYCLTCHRVSKVLHA